MNDIENSAMNPNRNCPKCGQALPPDAPEGLCPQCLLQIGQASNLAPSLLGPPAPTVPKPPASGAETTVIEGEAFNAARPTLHAPRSTPLTTLRYFGDYELLEEIARGGMGVVYKARQTSLNRIVAVKMILAGNLASEAEVKRFHTEAEAAANLQHPNIVAIHEVGEHEGQHYFSMDYVTGKNLAEIAREHPLSATRAAGYVKSMADAIHYAHQRGTLHRDLKPQNVLIDAADQPRITDFGLAKQVEHDSGLTRSGAVMGSPSYMPPEQASARQDLVGPASDVYSLGAILYELLTGQAPFHAETPAATMFAVLNDPLRPPSKANPRVPRDLETLCLKCLEKRPERRYHTARELGEELGRFLNHEPILARPAGRMRRGWIWALRHPWIIAGVASVIVLGLAGLAYGLWEQTRFMAWSMSHPGQRPKPREAFLFTTSCFGVFFFGGLVVCANIYFGRYYRFLGRAGQRLHHGWRWTYALLGAVSLLYAVFLSIEAINVCVWERNYWAFADICGALAVGWAASVILWQTVGTIDSSPFLPWVEKSMEADLKRWENSVRISEMNVLRVCLLGFCLFFSFPGMIALIHHVPAVKMPGFAAVAEGLGWLAGWGCVRSGARRQSWPRFWIVAGLAALAGGAYWGFGSLYDSEQIFQRANQTGGADGTSASLGEPVLAEIILGGSTGGLLAAALWVCRIDQKRRCESARPKQMRDHVKLTGWDIASVVSWVAALTAIAFDTSNTFHARRAREDFKRYLAARGESLDWQASLAPAVPDDQNFGTTPLLQAIGYPEKLKTDIWSRFEALGPEKWPKWEKDELGMFMHGKRMKLSYVAEHLGQVGHVASEAQQPGEAVLAALASVEPQLQELREARHRPRASLHPPGFQQILVEKRSHLNLDAFQTLARFLEYHAIAALAMGRAESAIEDLETLQRLADVLKENQLTYVILCRQIISFFGQQIIWEGLLDHRWSETQLARLQRDLQSVDFLRDLDQGLLREMAFQNEAVAQSVGHPHFLLLAETLTVTGIGPCVHYLKRSQSVRETLYDVKRRRVFPPQAETASRSGTALDFLGLPLGKRIWNAAYSQTLANLALVSCALERYFLAQQDYPASLEWLTPRFLETVPQDLIDGQPLKYRRGGSGRFILYSVGWDGVDDGGADLTAKNGKESGDWVWPCTVR